MVASLNIPIRERVKQWVHHLYVVNRGTRKVNCYIEPPLRDGFVYCDRVKLSKDTAENSYDYCKSLEIHSLR